jgi:hypothetical protein
MWGTFGWRKWIVWAAFACILAPAAWLRIEVVEETVVDHPIQADAKDYYLFAYNLVFHGTYNNSSSGLNGPGVQLEANAGHYPGLPLIIAAFIWRDHKEILSAVPTVSGAAVLRDVQMLNVVAGVSAVALIFFTASLAIPPWAALGAALLTAISPHLVSFTVYMLTEPISAMLACLLLATVAAVAAKGERAPGSGPFVGIGIIAGVLAMFRPIYLLCAPVVALASSRAHARRRVLVGALHEIARRFAADPLGMAAWYGFGKMRYLWQWDNADGSDIFIYWAAQTPFRSRALFVALHDAMKACHWGLIALALAGSIAVWLPAIRDLLPERGRPVLRAASLLLAYTSVMLIPFFTCTRYAVPVFPAMFMTAMVPPAMALEAIARRRRRSLKPALPR